MVSQDSGDIEIGNLSINWAVVSVRKSLYQIYNDSLKPTSCIYRVDKRIRKVNKDAYTPDIFSIGPYHRSDSNLKAMENQNLVYLKAVLHRTSEITSLEMYVEAFKKLGPEACKCYSEPVDLNFEQFIEMMLVDGFFIVELFRKNSKVVTVDGNDPIFNFNSRVARVMCDLILLENQIPMLLVPQTLFDLSENPESHSRTFIELCSSSYPKSSSTATHNHLVDLLCYTLSASLPTPSIMPTFNLRRSSMKFKIDSSSNTLIHIKFNEGITSYAIMIDYLINSADDVAFLWGREIVSNQLGDDNKIPSLLSNLFEGISSNGFNYGELCDKVNHYYNNPYRYQKAKFKHDYCSNPWANISVVVAILLFVFNL
ncbi:hypothetical protein NE237_007062 [Protea cynaroides]|uniref:Uncharacterized protein n=1 Tax=Protea cynaroides TaxID=273540 RepID=A0A9Q0QVW0_9MAGN|nr:hypothetical protein NE237_007062 [Protea cynaroides]